MLDDVGAIVAKKIVGKDIYNYNGVVSVLDPEVGSVTGISGGALRSWFQNPRCGNLVPQHWVTGEKKGECQLEDYTLSKDYCTDLMACPSFKGGIRFLAGTLDVRLPIRQGDDIVALAPPGYDPISQRYVFDKLAYETDWSIDAAKEYFSRDLLGEVSYRPGDEDRSRSSHLAAILAPYVDRIIDQGHNRPAFLYDGNAPGSGKDTALKLSIVSVDPQLTISAAPTPESGDEFTKTLNAAMRRAKPTFAIGNWRGTLQTKRSNKS